MTILFSFNSYHLVAMSNVLQALRSIALLCTLICPLAKHTQKKVFCIYFQVTVDHSLQSGWYVYLTLPISHLNIFCLCSNLPRCGVRSHDCLYSRRHHLEHAGLWLFTHPACDIMVSLIPPVLLSLLSVPFQPDWLWSVTPWPTCSHTPIPPKRLKDKLNLMPCNKLSGLLCIVRHCVSQWRNGTFWSVWKSWVNMEPDPKHICRGRS